MTKQNLTIDLLCKEAGLFAADESAHDEPSLYGVTDGKAVGTYLEHKFQRNLSVDQSRTADFQTTSGLRKILENNGNTDDVIAFFSERMLPVDEIQALELAEKVISNPPEIGYLTISNALQWRLQYSRVIQEAGIVLGISKVY
ncbi:MAG: type II restriction endonuclease [Candidatus Electrothrix sp. AX1]|nr:type II restriction endonuclease [Candidatus Electrothrix sp. AX1]